MNKKPRYIPIGKDESYMIIRSNGSVEVYTSPENIGQKVPESLSMLMALACVFNNEELYNDVLDNYKEIINTNREFLQEHLGIDLTDKKPTVGDMASGVGNPGIENFIIDDRNANPIYQKNIKWNPYDGSLE